MRTRTYKLNEKVKKSFDKRLGFGLGSLFTIGLAVAVIALSSGSSVSAATRDVCPSGCTYDTIQEAIDAAVAGDVIEVQPGIYNEDLVVTKDNIEITGVGSPTPTVTTTGTESWSVELTGRDEVEIRNLKFEVDGKNSLGYHFKVYQSEDLTLENLEFIGAGKNVNNGSNIGIGGIDFSATRRVDLTNVSAKNYSKNGVAITAKFVEDDNFSHHYAFDGLVSDNNGLSGIAFYNQNKMGTLVHNNHITHITFVGERTNLTNNGQAGVLVQVPSDESVFTTGNPGPRHVTSGGVNIPLILDNVNFSGNFGFDIFNYQKHPVDATNAKFQTLFGLKTGTEMNTFERAVQDNKIFDVNDITVPGNNVPNPTQLGKVTYY